MIDLRKPSLPSSLVVNGEVFPIVTDFRTWIAWLHDIETEKKAPYYIFVCKYPTDPAWVTEALSFARSENVTPRKSGEGNGEKAYDLVLDGDYIVSSFMMAYGIDLTSVDYMHWHVFKALLSGLPDSTILSRIMGYRTYRRGEEKKKQEDVRENLRRIWSLGSDARSADYQNAVELQRRLFGKVR